MSGAVVRNARDEATTRLGGGRVARVLEPSPPTVDVGPWFADQPTALDGDDADVVVSPVGNSHIGWDEVVAEDPALASFARERWLASFKPLGVAPGSLGATREALRALAFSVLSPARQHANGKIGLRWTKGGFGTPFFGSDRQLRVEGDLLVVQDGDDVSAERITTLRAAAHLVGVTPGPPAGIDFHDPPPEVDPDARLEVDPEAAAYLDDWFGFATLVLERLHTAAGSPPDTRVQLWSEHFDIAVELGDVEASARASYGASPGDDSITEPYLYLSPWSPQQGDFWNAPFGGAALPVSDLRRAPDAVDAGLEFFERGRQLLG